jgi:NAD(P)H-hydrate epimerase
LVGSGWGPNVRPFVEAALAGASKLVLDGGALFPDIKARPDATLILTPHPGEFARMFPKLGGGKIAQAQWAADQTGAVIVLKGADTVIAAPNGEARVNVNASSALATAGSGDVLAGMILSLLAQGMDGFEAACAACALHGQAGIELGAGTIAEDIVEHLPAILKRK